MAEISENVKDFGKFCFYADTVLTKGFEKGTIYGAGKGVLGLMAQDAKKGEKIIAQNKKAWHDYFVLDKYEAGIELVGTEVKSVRAGNVNLKDSFCIVKNGEIFVHGMHISPYEKGSVFNRDPLRVRRLLMHKREILKLGQTVKQEGLALVPLKIYFSAGRIKLEIGLCKGKKLYDKRDAEAERDAKREIDGVLKSRSKDWE